MPPRVWWIELLHNSLARSCQVKLPQVTSERVAMEWMQREMPWLAQKCEFLCIARLYCLNSSCELRRKGWERHSEVQNGSRLDAWKSIRNGDPPSSINHCQKIEMAESQNSLLGGTSAHPQSHLAWLYASWIIFFFFCCCCWKYLSPFLTQHKSMHSHC